MRQTAQTAFTAIADLFYCRANLEHAAASPTGLGEGALLVALLAMLLIAAAEPPVTVWGVHPVSLAIPVAASDDDGAAVLEPGVTCWRIAQADRLAVIIDAADYFRALKQAILSARMHDGDRRPGSAR